MDFYELDINDNILDALDDMRFETCTPIQEQCIPVILDGKDVLGVAQTGTGKTAAYLLPVLSKLDDGGYPKDAINCLIMSPTRELAQQIDREMQGFGYYLDDVSSVAVYGGNDGGRYDRELNSFKKGADVVIATPGRLISHISMGNIDLSRVSFFILDEADRMLDMGFYDDIMTIASNLPKTCQTILFSATMPDKIEEMSSKLLKNPVKIKIAPSMPAEKIVQGAYVCYPPQKLNIVKNIFKTTHPEKAIIFAGSKQKVKDITISLKKLHINCDEMHSDLSQEERDELMFNFKSGKINVVVATDIISRGIDIDDITLVINYDVPHDPEDYIHRIGRTARAGSDGSAITLVAQDEIGAFMKIEHVIKREVNKLPVPSEFGETPEYKYERTSGKGRSGSKHHQRGSRGGSKHGSKPVHNRTHHNEHKQNSDNVSKSEVKNSSRTVKNKSGKSRRKPQKDNN